MSDNLYATLRDEVLTALKAVVPDLPADVLARVEVTPTREAAHGDMATNAAMVAAKPARQPPAKIAQALAEALRGHPDLASAEPAGPGFVNLRLEIATIIGVLPTILRRGIGYGDSTLGNGTAANVEYVSANPTGPMHIGHCRGAVVGDALANLLAKTGHAVTKEYYINDAGAQVAALAWATYWRYLQALGTGLTEEEFAAAVPGGLQYRGDYLVPVGEALARQYGTALAAQGLGIADPESWFDIVRESAVAEMMRQVREDLVLLGVDQNVFSSERALLDSGAVDAVIARLDAKGLIYEGVLEPPKGRVPDDWEPRPQLLFRATAFGDDVDRPLRKSDGSNTYFANDIAYHADKIDRGFAQLIDVWGADHGGYVSRMQAAVQALSDGAVKLEIVLCQIVHVMRGGEPVRMSKRAGTYVTLRDLIDEVGRDAVRFTMLTRKSDAQMEFDLDQAVAQTRENPVFYVQYAHARAHSVLRKAKEMFPDHEWTREALAAAPLDRLTDPAEIALIRQLAAWPRLVEGAAEAEEPHRIAFYMYDLAAAFHGLWTMGKDDAALRFLVETDPALSLARGALVLGMALVIASGLAVFGVEPKEEMR